MIADPSAPVVVLAPHPDDAVLSAWSVLRRPTEVLVITVCAGTPPEGTAGSFDRVIGVTDSAPLAQQRRDEDIAALATAGRRPIHLGHLDDQYRDGPLPEASLGAELGEVVAAASELWAPAGIGRHPDHLAVRAAAIAQCATTGVALSLYAELPYAVQFGWPSWVTGEPPDPGLVPDALWADTLAEVPGVLEPHAHQLQPAESAAKRAAIECYASQVAVLDAGPHQRLRNPHVIGFEASWSVTLGRPER